MYTMLLKVYHSSFSAFTAYTFEWLINGRSLVKTKFLTNHLVDSLCFQVQSITRAVSIQVRKAEVTAWKYTEKSTVHGTWKIQYQVADAKIDWLKWWCSSRFTRYCTLNSSNCKKRHIFSALSFYKLINFCHFPVASIQDLLEKSYVNFFMDNFDLVLLNKLSSGPLCTSMC